MNKIVLLLIIMTSNIACQSSKTESESRQTYYEISVQRHEGIEGLYSNLTPQERIVAYFLYRACLPGNRILTDQHHRHALAIQEMFEHLYKHQNLLEKNNGTEFVKQIKTFLVYLWTNHGQYFVNEPENNKRTPGKLKLHLITAESLTKALQEIGLDDAEKIVNEVSDSLFNQDVEPTLSVAGSIEKSAINIYAPGFTKAHYDALSPSKRGRINGSYLLDTLKKPQMHLYSAQEKYAHELSVAVHWFEKTHDWSARFPQQFDEHFVASLKHLIAYLKTGDEELFKEHSRAWLKTHSRLDYTFGFIETYHDPLGNTGLMEAEVTIKNYELTVLASLLPTFENHLPLPTEFKRENMTVQPNASINTQLFGAGDLGPLKSILAYCLPNYNEIRSKDGSKQIIYPAEKNLAESMNPELAQQLYRLREHITWHKKHDPEFLLPRELKNLLTTLHETIGHASGRLAQHTFKEGEPLTLGNTTYNVGDTINLTSGLLSELLVGYENSIEELRAEIIALYSAIHHLEDLASHGFLTEWHKSLSKNDLLSRIILQMAYKGIARLLNQPESAEYISGAHPQANTCIMNYLIDKGGIELVKETVTVAGSAYTVVDLRIADLDRCIEVVTELMQRVQRIKSTGDRLDAQKLIDTYGKPARKDVIKIVKDNLKAIVGDLRVQAVTYPFFTPLFHNGEMCDVKMTWPEDFFQANMKYSQLALSKEDDEVLFAT